MCVSGKRQYLPDAHAPAAARNFAHAIVAAVLPPAGWGLADDLELVISELVAGALAAEPSRVDVTVDVHYDHLCATVLHDGAPLVAAGHRDDPLTSLRETVVHSLTTDFTTRRESDGRTETTARVPCDPTYTQSVVCELRPS